jgi:LPXTG-motif cell wall-anchored protein
MRTLHLLARTAAAAMACSGMVAVGPATAASAAPTPSATLAPDMTLAVGPSAAAPTASPSGCQLANGVQHVFYLGFDNLHLRRDNANDVANNGDDNDNSDLDIPSDLEQIPALYNFLRGTSYAGQAPNPNTANNANYANGRNTTYSDGTPFPGGTILANHHTPLISHTSVDFTTSYTGVYGDRHGVAVSQNSMAAYTGNASTPVSSASGFSYWTDPLGIGDDPTTVITTKDANGNPVNAPAPWVPYTRAGCDVGAVAATGFTLENAKSASTASTATTKLTTADEGLAVHCAQASTICGSSANAVPDTLPSEPDGYSGYSALFGHEYIAPVLNQKMGNGSSATLPLLPGRPSTSSFPGFNGEDGNYTLGYTLDMQKAGIPITFGYLSDAHDCHSGLYGDYAAPAGSTGAAQCDYTDVPGTATPTSAGAFGSGEAGYVNYLHQLNSDFQSFFDQAKADGFTTANTEFVFYSDESDHAAEATPANGTGATACDGVTVPCQYDHSTTQTTPTAGQLGEATTKLDAAFPQSSQPYFVLDDSAPDFYLENPGSAAPPGQDDANVRSFERSIGGATYTDPYTGDQQPLADYMADRTELNALHMITADPQRSPTFTAFAPGEDYVESGYPSDCGGAANATCSDYAYAYVHGDYAPEVNTTWAGFAGPGVANHGVDSSTWTDQTDLRPTLLALVGLHDDYTDEGRVITQILDPGAVSSALTAPQATDLATLLKKLDAPVYSSAEGTNDGFGPATLVADTEALKSDAANDSTYTDVEGRISTITAQRNAVVSDILARLTAAASGSPVDPGAFAADESAGTCLLAYANDLKAYALAPSASAAPTACTVSLVTPALPETGHIALFVVISGFLSAGAVLWVGRRRRRLAV